MKCDRCGREITGQVFTAIGTDICEECNTKSHGTVSIEDVLAKIEIMQKVKLYSEMDIELIEDEDY